MEWGPQSRGHGVGVTELGHRRPQDRQALLNQTSDDTRIPGNFKIKESIPEI